MARVDVFIDPACPWCFIGKRNLDQAAQLLGVQPPSVRWRAFELQPQLPADGLPARNFFPAKFGSEQMMHRAFEMATRAGADAGITFRFDLLERAPNTRLAHRVIAIVRTLAGPDAESAVVDGIFDAYFCRGADICRLDVLEAVVRREVGAQLDVELVLDELALGGGMTDVEADLALAAQLGVRGVPFYISEDLRAVSGAQQPELLAGFLADTALV